MAPKTTTKNKLNDDEHFISQRNMHVVDNKVGRPEPIYAGRL